jgi:hypothetical protein
MFTEPPEGVAAGSCAVVANVIVSNAESTAAFLFNPDMQDKDMSLGFKDSMVGWVPEGQVADGSVR